MMKRAFVLYAIVWAILLAAFNVICLATPNEIFGLPKADTAFWVSFALINVSFVGQLFCAFLAFKGDSLRKLFYRLSLITISYVDLSIMTVLGVIILVIPFIPNWVGAIVSGALLVFGAISVIAAKGASEAVERIDDKVAARTSFVTNLIITAEGLRARAKSDAVKAECKKVYEAIRFSDPVSNEALSTIEAQITDKMGEFSAAVTADDVEQAKEIADEIVILVGDRNKKCKALK